MSTARRTLFHRGRWLLDQRVNSIGVRRRPDEPAVKVAASDSKSCRDDGDYHPLPWAVLPLLGKAPDLSRSATRLAAMRPAAYVNEMRVLRQLSPEEMLVAWGRHEALGRFRDEIPPDILRLIEEDSVEGREHALVHGNSKRAPVIAAVKAAHPTLVVEIEVTGDDLDDLRVMCRATDLPRHLAAHAEALLAAPGDEANYVRNLAAGEMPVVGPFVAVARTVPGPLTIIDGVHRGSAWVAHLRAGRHYPLAVAVILTLHRTVFESEQGTYDSGR